MRCGRRHRRVHGRGGVSPVHRGRRTLVAGRDALDPRGRRRRDRLRGARGRRGIRALRRRREGPLGDRRELGAAVAARARLEHPRARAGADRGRGPLHRAGAGVTRVDLEHRGWEALPEGAEKKRSELRHRLGERARRHTSKARAAEASGDAAGQRNEVAQAPGTSAVAPPTAPPRSPATWTEDEERRLAEPALLEPELALARRTCRVYATLPTNAIDRRPERARDLLQPLGSAGEVGLAQLARAARRASRRVREPDAEREQLGRLLRREQPRREPGGVQQPPEVVPRIRERRARAARSSGRG